MLFIATVEVTRIYYTEDGRKKSKEIIPVEAEDENDAYDILTKYYKKQNDPYHVWVNHSVQDLQPVLTRQSLDE